RLMDQCRARKPYLGALAGWSGSEEAQGVPLPACKTMRFDCNQECWTRGCIQDHRFSGSEAEFGEASCQGDAQIPPEDKDASYCFRLRRHPRAALYLHGVSGGAGRAARDCMYKADPIVLAETVQEGAKGSLPCRLTPRNQMVSCAASLCC